MVIRRDFRLYGPYQMGVLLFAYAISELMYFNEDGKPQLKWHRLSHSLISEDSKVKNGNLHMVPFANM